MSNPTSDQRLLIFIRPLLSPFRRHFTGAHLAENLFPELIPTVDVARCFKRVKPDTALFLSIAVTTKTVVFDEWQNISFKIRLFRFHGNDESAAEHICQNES